VIDFLSDTGEGAAETVFSLSFEHKDKEPLQMVQLDKRYWTPGSSFTGRSHPLERGEIKSKSNKIHTRRADTHKPQSYADVLCLSLEQRRVLPFHADSYPNAVYAVYQKPSPLYIW
jgi:hypothetical protein